MDTKTDTKTQAQFNTDDAFDFQEYLSAGVEHFVRDTLKATYKNPKASAFLLKFAAASKKASRYRKQQEKLGRHIPPFLIASITGSCNLHCAGCYSRGTHETNDEVCHDEMSGEDWGNVFGEAKELGISFIVLAGGEPLLRPDVIEQAGKEKSILFPVFTNGTFIDKKYFEIFTRNRNLVPVMSIEGDKEATDRRRGAGVYDTVAENMVCFKEQGLIFGASVTVTKENFTDCVSEDFIAELADRGSKFLFLTEYVPVDGAQEEIAPGDTEREYLKEKTAKLRAEYPGMVFVSIPGDEKSSGGCLAAGRGFFHINAQGFAEPCPMSPYSDTNVKEKSIAEALESPLFRKLKDTGALTQDHEGGCVLAAQEMKVKEMCEGREY